MVVVLFPKWMKEECFQSSRKYKRSHVIYTREILRQASVTPEMEIILDVQLLIHGNTHIISVVSTILSITSPTA